MDHLLYNKAGRGGENEPVASGTLKEREMENKPLSAERRAQILAAGRRQGILREPTKAESDKAAEAKARAETRTPTAQRVLQNIGRA